MKKAREVKLYKIEKGIRIPDVTQAQNGRPSLVALTLAILEKGDSFLIKDALEAMKGEKVVRGFNKRGRSSGRVFTTRKTGNGVRIWRTK